MTEHKQHKGNMRNQCQILLSKKALGPRPGWENSNKIYIKGNTIGCCGQDSIAEVCGPVVCYCEKCLYPVHNSDFNISLLFVAWDHSTNSAWGRNICPVPFVMLFC